MTTQGDATGLHVLVADAKDGYTWRTAATLAEPGTEVDQWIGQACLTGSGRRAVVAYSPRQAVNHVNTFGRGALAAIVDLDSGTVIKLADTVSLAYYNPGCGSGEQAVFTQAETVAGKYVSRLLTVDTAAGAVMDKVEVVGQVTSAVPTNSGLVAAKGNNLVAVGKNGSLTNLAVEKATPFRLGVDSGGGVAFEVQHDGKADLHRIIGTVDHVLGSVPEKTVRLHSGGGRVYAVGPNAGHDLRSDALPAGWATVNAPADSEMSTQGQLAVTATTNQYNAAGKPSGAQPGVVLPIRIRTIATATGAKPEFIATPNPKHVAQGLAPSPALPGGVGRSLDRAAGDPSHDTTDPNRKCAIPRNDPKIQSLQETPDMAEWAADLAVKGALNVQRPAGYNGSNLPAYTPQGMFPPHPLTGGGQVPAQVLLGIMAQESNLWQASPKAVDGESGNFEQGGFYGRGVGVDRVDFNNADCGYGATQVTTGMQVGQNVYSYQQQVALTVDYAANVAAGLEILQDKWNQMKALGVVANNADPSVIENWWFALWAYNGGWHAANDPNDPYSKPDAFGLGWSNNVVNEDFTQDRDVFGENTTPCDDNGKDPKGNCIDAKHPGSWSYPERIMGWASHSLTRYDWRSGTYAQTFVKANFPAGLPIVPAAGTFCTADNNCDMSKIHMPSQYPGDPGSHCQRDDLACYWHSAVSWQNKGFGTENVRFQPGTAEPTAYRLYNADCSTAGLPSGALVIDDVSADVRTQSGCAKNFTSQGSLSFAFASDASGQYPSKIDFHQLDSGFGGHMWTAHTWRNNSDNAKHAVTGTWTLNRQLNWARVLVYIPDHGAMTPQAFYTVHGSDSSSPARSVVEGNYLDDKRKPAPGHWESLGAFNFNGTTPSVSLDNLSHAMLGTNWPEGELGVVWDAVAFQPLPGKPANQVVALGDSYASGEGASNDPVDGAWDYYRSSDHDGRMSSDGDDPRFRDACHRSRYSWSRGATLKDNPATSIGLRADEFDSSLDYHMSACSGATTGTMLTAGQYSEGSQLDQGYLDQNTTLVTFSVGGNDARFTDVMTKCVFDLVEVCQDGNLEGDPQPMKVSLPDRLNNVVGPAVEGLIEAVKNAAPHAKILVMGYPRLLERYGSCIPLIGTAEAPWLNQMADLMNEVISKAASTAHSRGIDVAFSDPRGAFAGKAACGDPAEIHGIVVTLTRGDETGVKSAQTLHPTVGGAAIYAGVATSTLRQMGI